MTGWAEYIAAFVAFFATHSVPLRPYVRSWLTARLGQRGFTLTYSVVSLSVLIWLIVAAGRAPFVPLWDWAPWQLWVPLVAMAMAIFVLVLAIGKPNPFSFGGRLDMPMDTSDPGIVGWVRHPLLVCLILWAGSHLVPNGDLAHVVLFGVFCGFAILGHRIIDRRKQRQLGAQWDQMWRETRAGRRLSLEKEGRTLLVKLAIAIGLYFSLLLGHQALLGVPTLAALM